MGKLALGALAVFSAMSLSAAVVATVNGQSVTDEDVGVLLRQMPGVTYEQLPAEMKKQVLDQAIDRKLLMAEAIREGVEKDKEFTDAMAKIKNEVALEIWMKKQFDAVKLNSSAAQKFYDENANAFMRPERVKVRHILVTTEDEGKKIIKDLSALKGKALTDKFAEFAKANPDATAQTGGNLDWVGKDDPFVEEFKTAAFALKKGEISKTPVKTQFGYHVVYVEDKEAAGKAKFDDVKQQIEGKLKGDEFRKNIEARAKTLRDKAKVEIK